MWYVIFACRDPATFVTAEKLILSSRESYLLQCEFFLWPLIYIRRTAEFIKYLVSVFGTMASRADTARVTCSFCGKAFLTRAEMEEHTKRDHTEQKDPVGVG